MRVLVFDTETTGVPPRGCQPLDPRQPRCVQLAALLVDESSGKELEAMSVIIRPTEPFHIHEEATKVHGITDDMCREIGVPLMNALSVFSHMVKAADIVVAHNIHFDLGVIQTELWRLNKPDRLKGKESFCTQAHGTAVCKLPRKRGGGFKWPKLMELHKYLFGLEFDGAHDAMVDVRACWRCYLGLTGKLEVIVHNNPVTESMFEANGVTTNAAQA